MNFPVWDVAFGAGLLMALVAGLHVFVSHFAVGGGLFLVLTERKARRNNDAELLNWLKSHTRFFVLVTVVFGAVSGVGIWFTIGLISPTATSDLIHIWVWGWAIEWVFFFLEITSALLYLYGWDKLEPKLHQWYGWIYFITAYASLVVINGIITFMLTPGHWIENHEFWTGFFNPTYLPSLFFRICISLALAGIYALITASVQKNAALKARIVRWGALWTVPSLLLLPVFAWWYIRKIPADLWASARGAMPTGTTLPSACILLGGNAPAGACGPGKAAPFAPGLQPGGRAGCLRGHGFVRVRARVRAQALRHRELSLCQLALLPRPCPATADSPSTRSTMRACSKRPRGSEDRDLTKDNQVAVGREIFRVECESCHTAEQLPRRASIHRLAPMGPGQDPRHAGQPLSDAQRRDAPVCRNRRRADALAPISALCNRRLQRRLRPRRWQDGLRARLWHVPSGARPTTISLQTCPGIRKRPPTRSKTFPACSRSCPI